MTPSLSSVIPYQACVVFQCTYVVSAVLERGVVVVEESKFCLRRPRIGRKPAKLLKFNPLHPNLSMLVFHTVLLTFTFLNMLIRRIC